MSFGQTFEWDLDMGLLGCITYTTANNGISRSPRVCGYLDVSVVHRHLKALLKKRSTQTISWRTNAEAWIAAEILIIWTIKALYILSEYFNTFGHGRTSEKNWPFNLLIIHVSLSCRNEQEVLRFYQDLLNHMKSSLRTYWVKPISFDAFFDHKDTKQLHPHCDGPCFQLLLQMLTMVS